MRPKNTGASVRGKTNAGFLAKHRKVAIF